MTSLLPFTQDLIRAFGWTLLHSFWQAFFVFACLRIVLRLWPQASASIKYHLSFLSLAGITGWFVATLYAQLSAIKEAQELRRIVTVHLSNPDVMARAIQQAPAKAGGLQVMFPGMEGYFPVLVGIYIVGVTVMTIKLCLDLSQLRHVKRQGVTPIGIAWERHLKELGERLGITKKVQLFISDHLQVPVMIGFLKPVILLPAAMMNNLSQEQLEAILLHELAHIKRNDYLLNIFQSIVETILFFNPFVWWISRNIRQEREHCCDDLVIAGTVQPMHYAKALVALEEYRITANPMAMAAAHDKHFLLHRIKRIMEMKTKNLNYSQRFLALLIIVTGLVSIAWLNPARKNEKKEKTRTSVTDTIPPKAPLLPGITPEPPAPPVPPAPVKADALATPPAPPAPNAAPLPHPVPVPLAPLAPMTPMTPSPVAAPLPPMPPTPPTWFGYSGNGNRNFYYNDNFNISVDTLAPGQKIVITDDKGNRKEYRSIDEMPAADRKRMEESFYNMQQHLSNFNKTFSEEDFRRAMKNAQDVVSKMDWSKMNAQIQESMKNVDWNAINKQVSESMKNIDWNKINTDVAKQMKEIQWDKMSQQLKDQMQKQDWDKISKDVRESLEKVDWKKIENEVRKSIEEMKLDSSRFHFNYNYDYDFKYDSSDPRMEEARARARAQHDRAMARSRDMQERNMERIRKQQEENVARTERMQAENMERIRKQQEQIAARNQRIQAENMERIKRQQEQNLARTQARTEEAMKRAERDHERAQREHERAQREHEKAEAVNAGYRKLLEGLESEKLIDRGTNYSIEKKGGELFINGKKQPDDILKKYEQYLKNDNVFIHGNKNSLSIQSRNDQ